MADYGDELSIDTSEFDGLADLLERFPLDLQNKLLAQSLKAGATVLQLSVIDHAPMRSDEKTAHQTSLRAGYLKADIRIEPMKNRRGYWIGAGAMTAHVLRWLERGHQIVKGGQLRTRGSNKELRVNGKLVGGGVVGHVPAYPVLRPAFDSSRETAVRATYLELQNRIADYWRQTIQKVKKVA